MDKVKYNHNYVFYVILKAKGLGIKWNIPVITYGIPFLEQRILDKVKSNHNYVILRAKDLG